MSACTRMKNYNFSETFKTIYDKAVALYADGKRGAENFFDPGEKAFLAANGITAQHLYDYAEDQNNYQEPGYDIALSIELVRRDYFLNNQKGKASAAVLKSEDLPAKDAAVNGITWLPRILPKTRAKLRGELDGSLMYCCGGDRKFLKANDINPAEFLTLIWRHEGNDQAIIDWVTARTQAR